MRSVGVRGASTAVLHVVDHTIETLEGAQAPARDGDDVATTIGWVGLAPGQSPLDEVVERRHHVAPVDARAAPELGLAARPVLVERRQQPEVVPAQTFGSRRHPSAAPGTGRWPGSAARWDVRRLAATPAWSQPRTIVGMTNDDRIVGMTNDVNQMEATMSTPFGPQLIGETEKTLNALLLRHLDGTGLTEPQWVTLRLSDQLDGTVDTDGLVAAVADRAHFPDADRLSTSSPVAGCSSDGRPTAAGRELLTAVQAAVATDMASLFGDLATDDVAAATRVLNEVVGRARVALAPPA